MKQLVFTVIIGYLHRTVCVFILGKTRCTNIVVMPKMGTVQFCGAYF